MMPMRFHQYHVNSKMQMVKCTQLPAMNNWKIALKTKFKTMRTAIGDSMRKTTICSKF